MLIAASGAMACTNFIVGKKASKDGSVICSYSADSYGMFTGLRHQPAAKHQKGDMRKIYEWDTNKYLGEIPEAAETYNTIGNINEWQVTIGETTFGGREEMVDTTGIIDYGSLIYIALQRAKTAREAISIMTTLVEQYGYCSEGETFTICDPNEAWIMEMMGAHMPDSVKATLKPSARKQLGRTVWVALRIPDDMICGHANQSRITTFNMKDKSGDVLYSKNVVTYARQMGWFTGKDEAFSYNAAYAKPDFTGRRICDARVWSFFNRYADGMDRYLAWADGHDKDAEVMPLWVKPSRLLTVADVEAAMRDHFEGTPFSLDQDMGGGLWEMPYRPTPLYFEVDGKKYFNERPVSTQQAGFVYVSQMRSWLPRQVGGCFWFANDDGNMVPFTPVYCCATEAPRPYNTPGADDLNFSFDNAYCAELGQQHGLSPLQRALPQSEGGTRLARPVVLPRTERGGGPRTGHGRECPREISDRLHRRQSHTDVRPLEEACHVSHCEIQRYDCEARRERTVHPHPLRLWFYGEASGLSHPIRLRPGQADRRQIPAACR